MTEQLRYRIDRTLKNRAEEILRRVGCEPKTAISMFYAQVVANRGLPFKPSEFPALADFGVSLAEADAAEAAALAEFEAAEKAGQTFEFKGKLTK